MRGRILPVMRYLISCRGSRSTNRMPVPGRREVNQNQPRWLNQLHRRLASRQGAGTLPTSSLPAGSVRVSTLIDSLGDRRYVRTPHLGAKVLSGGRGTGGSTGRPWSAALPLLYVPGFDLHEDVLACRAVKRSPGPSLSLRLAGSSSQFRESRRSGRNRPLRDC